MEVQESIEVARNQLIGSVIDPQFPAQFAGSQCSGEHRGFHIKFLRAGKRSDHDRLETGILHKTYRNLQCRFVIAKPCVYRHFYCLPNGVGNIVVLV